jgi:16S rRNA (adenine1518-N6/adenine1519-N6)-dimethyltransferase
MRQKYGQNFLIDNNIADKIVQAAQLNEIDTALEIGPGKGILTKIIQPKIKKFFVVEIDKMLSEQLERHAAFNKLDNIKIINEDFLKFDFGGLNIQEKIKLISNLPYSVGTAIMQKILPYSNWDTAVFMLQKEAALRICAKPNSKDYAYISILCSYYADTEILFDVSPKCFRPQPKVISTVIKLKNKFSKPPEKLFFALVKCAFSMRRKTILNSLTHFIKENKNISCAILKKCNISALMRPDKLGITDFSNMAKEAEKYF